VYRKLASALHPDRETDAAERARKTRLMQRVNQAYERNDLLGLLGLQIEIEQIDTEHLAQVSEDRINHYNRVLKEQLAQLRTEIAACAAPFRAMLDAPFASSRPTTALAEERLEAELRETRRVLDQLRHDLVAFRDPVQLRATVQADLALRGDQRRQDAAMGEFADLLRTMATTAPRPVRPRRRR
jgi:curved DNA-binding protein CbpA